MEEGFLKRLDSLGDWGNDALNDQPRFVGQRVKKDGRLGTITDQVRYGNSNFQIVTWDDGGEQTPEFAVRLQEA